MQNRIVISLFVLDRVIMFIQPGKCDNIKCNWDMNLHFIYTK